MKQLCLATLISLAAGSWLGGCGEVTNDVADSSVPLSDAQPRPPDATPGTPDATPPDANPAFITLTHNTNPDVVTTDTFCPACLGETRQGENHYYRVFNLADFNILGDFDVKEVLVGIQDAQSADPSGLQPLQIQIHSLPPGAEFTRENLQFIAVDDFGMPNRQLRVMTLALSVPAVVPAGSSLVVEVIVPNGQVSNHLLLIGCNGFGQAAPSYLYAPSCNTADIVDFTTVNAEAGALVLSVRGLDLAAP